MSNVTRQGILCVVSGPSGSGKTTLCHRFAESDGDSVYSVSCTTRPPREGEVDGIDYHFLSNEEFEEKISAGELLEFAQVHASGRYYGTLKQPVVEALSQGIDVLMDLDVKGAQQVRALEDPMIASSLVDVFILPRSLEELMDRVRKRGPMTQEELDLRMKNASAEMQHWQDYHYAILSGEKEADFAEFGAILRAERHRSSRLKLTNQEQM
ncbi:MAG: guanylate kinase [Verrucomicrobiota bacterium]